jgi:hypothetical protein
LPVATSALFYIFFLALSQTISFDQKNCAAHLFFLAYKTIAIPGLQPGKSKGPAVLNSDRIEILSSCASINFFATSFAISIVSAIVLPWATSP